MLQLVVEFLDKRFVQIGFDVGGQRLPFMAMYFIGAVATMNTIWLLGDVPLAIVIWPNLIAIILLAPKVVADTPNYFERRPWIQNAEAHARYIERNKGR